MCGELWFTEHGNIFNWVEKKMYCDEHGIKYMHGVECYLTSALSPKVRDNYHTVLIAKNYDGVKELNALIDLSSQEDHFYYDPRLSLDEFKQISNNIIKISACLSSPLNKLRDEELIRYYDYLEVQPHVNNEDQQNYNMWLAAMSEKYKIPLIAGTDTHSISAYKAECRSILQKAKFINASWEDENDLTYKTYDELVNMFERQGALQPSCYMQAIENTNIMAASVEPFELDTSFKYPVLYDDEEAVMK